MEKLNLNHIIFISVFLLMNQTTMFAMQKNKGSITIKNFPQQNNNHTGGKLIKETRSQNLVDRLKNRFLTELPKNNTKKEPVHNIPTNNINLLSEAPATQCNDILAIQHTRYHINDDCCLEWTESNIPLF